MADGVTRWLLAGSALSIAVTAGAAEPVANPAPIRLEIDLDREHQTIDAFGASDAWTVDPTIQRWMADGHEKAITDLADLLFSRDRGIGLSGWRFNLGAGSFEQGEASRIPDPFRRAELLLPEPGGPIDERRQLGQIRLAREAAARGVETFVAFANSPPVWATKNGLAHPGGDPDVGTTNLDPNRLDDWMRFLVRAVKYLRQNDVPIGFVSPINESTWSWDGQSQEGNRYEMEEAKAVYRALGEALNRADLHAVEVDGAEVVEYLAALDEPYKLRFDGEPYRAGLAGSETGLYKHFISELLGPSDLREILGNRISLHGYWSDADARRLGELRDLVAENLRDVSPGARVWMSELCILGEAGGLRPFDGHGFDVDDMDYALHVARSLHRDLTRLDVSGWFWWLAVTPYDYKDGLLKIEPDLDPSTLQSSKLFWTLGQYSRFLRPGARRVELLGADDLDGVMASAFVSPGGQELVVVALNLGASTEIALDLGEGEHRRLTPSAAFVTDATHDLERMELSSRIVGLPARSAVTLVVPLGEEEPP